MLCQYSTLGVLGMVAHVKQFLLCSAFCLIDIISTVASTYHILQESQQCVLFLALYCAQLLLLGDHTFCVCGQAVNLVVQGPEAILVQATSKLCSCSGSLYGCVHLDHSFALFSNLHSIPVLCTLPVSASSHAGCCLSKQCICLTPPCRYPAALHCSKVTDC